MEEGDKIALVARNGSGKSTLLKIITGLDTADDGTVWVHKDIKVVMLQQDNDFDGNKSIWDNVLRLDKPGGKVVKEYELFLEEGLEDIDKLGELMARLDDLNAWSFESDLKQILGKLNLHHLNEKVGNLSGGQKKRVGLAQALMKPICTRDAACLFWMNLQPPGCGHDRMAGRLPGRRQSNPCCWLRMIAIF